MNYCIIFDNQTIAIEIPVAITESIWEAERYICKNFPMWVYIDKFGFLQLKEGVGYTETQKAQKWGYNILPLI